MTRQRSTETDNESKHHTCTHLDQDDNYVYEWPTHRPRPPVGWRAIV